MRRIAGVVAAAVTVLLIGVGPAQAAKPKSLYTPRHGKACKKGYRSGHLKVKGRRVRVCTKKAAKKKPVAGAEKVKLHAHLDPTFTQDPFNPFHVTYAFSASASEEPVAGEAKASDAPAPLPAGVLAFYSDGILECAINVGPAISGGNCPINYQALGKHQVTTLYSSGEQSATVTETEQINPIQSSTALSITFNPLPPSEWEPWSARISGGSFTNHGWRIGTLVVAIDTQPGGPLLSNLSCQGGETNCVYLEQAPVNRVIEVGVYTEEGGAGQPIGPLTFRKPQDGSGSSGWKPSSEITAGSLFLRGESRCNNGPCGYIGSSATVPFQFEPGSYPEEPEYAELPR